MMIVMMIMIMMILVTEHDKAEYLAFILSVPALAKGQGWMIRGIKEMPEEIGTPRGGDQKIFKQIRKVTRIRCAFLGKGGWSAVNDKYWTFLPENFHVCHMQQLK